MLYLEAVYRVWSASQSFYTTPQNAVSCDTVQHFYLYGINMLTKSKVY